jgi:AcrR family transcriptional regulator
VARATTKSDPRLRTKSQIKPEPESGPKAETRAGPGPRSKRAAILRSAVESFGEVGYEHTKWADVADRVGIGQTALYYYFESKAHCLLTIMHLELQRSSERFAEVTAGLPPGDALRAGIGAAFDVTEHEVLQMRILHSHMDLLASPRSSEREEEERLASRALVRRIEHEWTELLERGMSDGSFGRSDATATSRLVLGLIVSVWTWYRPGGSMTLPEVSRFVEGSVLRMVGAVDAPAPEPRVSAPSSRRPRKARSRS